MVRDSLHESGSVRGNVISELSLEELTLLLEAHEFGKCGIKLGLFSDYICEEGV